LGTRTVGVLLPAFSIASDRHPLQKIHVIEPFVNAVGFVENPRGDNSRLHCMTIEEYHRRQQAHLEQQLAHSRDAA